MKTRIISACVIIPLVAAAIILGGWIFHLALLALTLVAIFEMTRAFKAVEIKTMAVMDYAFAIAAAATVYFGGNQFLLPAVVLFAMVTFSIVMLIPKYSVKDAIGTVFIFIYPTVMMLMMSGLEKFGREYVIGAILASVITDTAAYFIGKRFGTTKLCPDISPNKTVAGAMGGASSTLVIFSIYWLIVYLIKGTPITVVSVFMWIFLSLLCGIFAQLGDLFASSVKRFCGVKDFSKLIPGHGGIMDRMDSILFTTALIYIFKLIGII